MTFIILLRIHVVGVCILKLQTENECLFFDNSKLYIKKIATKLPCSYKNYIKSG